MISNIFFSVLMMLVCTTTGCVTEDDPSGPSLKVGDMLPDFSVELTDGTIVSNSSLRGKIGVIVFFNTDCGDCRKELPVIQQLWETYKDDSEVVIAPISRAESASHVQAYWNENGLTMPYSPQDTKEVYQLFASSVIPRIYISNPSGVITAAYDDADMPTLATLEAAIQEAK